MPHFGMAPPSSKSPSKNCEKAFNDHAWAKSNIIVAVAAGSSDGTSGLRDASDATQRAEVEKFADVIFSSNPNDRDYWLGRRALEPDQIRDRYGALKPCLHGSDAHNALSVGAPEGDRFTWIKGEPIFDSLRQACIVPGGRTYVGNTPPTGATPSQVISKVYRQCRAMGRDADGRTQSRTCGRNRREGLR